MQAGAAATLTGLVCVAVSINLARILSVPGLPGLMGLTTAIFGLVLGCVFSFVAAVIGAWILLIEILR